MIFKDKQQCERTKIDKWSSFQLHTRWKTIGTLMALGTFVIMIGFKFTEAEPLWLKDVLRKTILASLLLVILAKEKNEDEMIKSIRSKAYTLAFVTGVIYSFIQPLADYVVHHFIYEPSSNNDFSYFQLLAYMLVVHIMFFEVLKRNR